MDTRSRGAGAKGKEGQVAFVVWGENGVEETGGFPYRLVFANDDAAGITPLISGLSSQNRQDILVYGQVIISATSPSGIRFRQLHGVCRWHHPFLPSETGI